MLFLMLVLVLAVTSWAWLMAIITPKLAYRLKAGLSYQLSS
ncbi:putative membrane protein [Anaplasma phagocytophilum str. CRT53-1]|uniref:Putative membrane protein n=1 Tax=Anaplasma phagocytophilum str. CRT53-1 TaxID=1359157 RepID=A0A0F3PNR3_ANAPH|nr:putative membrane protein [Anaplasma phagocytophilum str. CRT53-1]